MEQCHALLLLPNEPHRHPMPFVLTEIYFTSELNAPLNDLYCPVCSSAKPIPRDLKTTKKQPTKPAKPQYFGRELSAGCNFNAGY